MTPRGEEGIAELAEILVFDQPLDGTAQQVVDLARSSLASCVGVGVQLIDRDGQSARVFTDARSSKFDALQEALGDGPCVECLRDRGRHDLEPVTSDERWPSFGPSSRRAGLIACFALPLVARGDFIGALNLYAWPLVGFAGWDREHCTTFARHASMLLGSAQAYARTKTAITELEAQLIAIPSSREP